MKSIVVLRSRLDFLLDHAGYVRKARAFFEQRAKSCQLLDGTAGNYFNTAVRQISHETSDSQFVRFSLSEETKPDSLDAP
jgi:hypothetical protein